VFPKFDLYFTANIIKIDYQNEIFMRKFFLIVTVIILNYNLASAQEVFRFLNLHPSPRSAALAGSYVAVNDDPNVMFYNPAGIYAGLSDQISFSYLSHLADINSASMSYVKKYENIGSFAFGVQYIGYGDMKRADQFGNVTGSFSANDMAFTLSYSNQLDNNFNYGVSTKFIYSGIADVSSTGLAFDFGLQYLWVEQNWRFGFSAMNIGSQLTSYFDKKENLPVDVKLGVSKKLQHMPFEFFFSLNRLNDQKERFKNITFGGEFKLSEVIKLRIGYDAQTRKELKLGTTTGLAGFNFGAGIKIKNYFFDYGFSSYGLIGGLHRIGISTKI